MEIILGIIAIVIAVMSENAKKQKKAAGQMKEILAEAAQSLQNGRVSTGSAFEQARQRATQSQQKEGGDPGRVTAQSAARQKQQRKQMEAAAPRPRTRREAFERSSAYEQSNRMDVRYTSNGCGCSTGRGNASSGKAHGSSSAAYDEEKFFRESREICSGNWS